MKFLRKIKQNLLDFEHPPKPSVVAVLDAFLVIVILLFYASVQHVIPAHFLSGRLLQVKNRIELRLESEEPVATPSTPTPSAIPTPLPTVTPAAAEASVPVGDPDLSEKFSDRFSDSIVCTNNFYSSPDLSVQIIEHAEEIDGLAQHWFEADIYTSDIHCLQTFVHRYEDDGLVGDSMINMSRQSGSIVAINGDYAVTTDSGIIVRNGEILRDNPGLAQICVLFEDGSMKCFAPDEYDSAAIFDRGVWQAWTFGPSLLDVKGNALSDFSAYYGSVLEKNPRTVLGYYEPGHYCFVVIDGRQPGYASGMDMVQTAQIMEGLGCKLAFNLDGGRSSQMSYGTDFVNHPYSDGRYVGDIVIAKDFFSKEDLP